MERSQNMKTFKLSISVIVILAVGITESLAGKDSILYYSKRTYQTIRLYSRYRRNHKHIFGIAAPGDCTVQSSWSEWGQCSESCGTGFRERICSGLLFFKEREKCQARSNNCETISGTQSS